MQLPLALGVQVLSLNLMLTNDDGWATAQERAVFNTLDDAGYNLVLSAPAENQSGTGSTSRNPTVRTTPCQFNSCSPGSAVGADVSDVRLNWVNAFPVDSVRYGIQTLSPAILGGRPDFVVSGPNIGSNLGLAVVGSGTVGAAAEATKQGIPAIAFSGVSGSSVPYTTLASTPNAASSLAAQLYASLSLTILDHILSQTPPFLPANTFLNVNFPDASRCPSTAQFKFVLTRVFWNPFAVDVRWCGKGGGVFDQLPLETDVVGRTDGCFVAISMMDARDKTDAPTAGQAMVLPRLQSLLSCLP